MSDITTHPMLRHILTAKAQKHVTHNKALRPLDAMVQLSMLGRGCRRATGRSDAAFRWVSDLDPAMNAQFPFLAIGTTGCFTRLTTSSAVAATRTSTATDSRGKATGATTTGVPIRRTPYFMRCRHRSG